LTTYARSEMFEDVVPDVVIVDSVLLEDMEDVDGPACTAVGPQNPSFVIFTSGSTGRPKGVVLEHAAMVSSAAAHGKNLGIGTYLSRLLNRIIFCESPKMLSNTTGKNIPLGDFADVVRYRSWLALLAIRQLHLRQLLGRDVHHAPARRLRLRTLRRPTHEQPRWGYC